jgi:molybdopterin molybdotransferase
MPISFDEAAEIVRQQGLRLAGAQSIQGPEVVTLDAALGRILAEPIFADRDQPPFPRSTRDGFACRAADASTNHPLILGGTIRAGQDADSVADLNLDSGQAWEIMTGAPVPLGADAVFMVEHAEVLSQSGPRKVRLIAPRTLEQGENIVSQGAEALAGESLTAPGKWITPALIALAAQFGYGRLAVFCRPRVAILSTGDELVATEATPGPNQIRNSNSPMLAALVTAAGGTPILLPTVADNEAAVNQAIEDAKSTSVAADLLLISGGISAGRFDLVEGALGRSGGRFFFRQVAMQPGKPVVFGEVDRIIGGKISPLPFFALPGNPVSSAVTFQLFARQILWALSGVSNVQTEIASEFPLAKLSGEWRGKAGLTRFLPAWRSGNPEPVEFSKVSANPVLPSVRLVAWQGSGDIVAFSRCNCFAVIPPDATEIADGSIIHIMITSS